MKATREWCSTERIEVPFSEKKRQRCSKCGRLLSLDKELHNGHFIPAHKGKYKVQRATKSGDGEVSRRRTNTRH